MYAPFLNLVWTLDLSGLTGGKQVSTHVCIQISKFVQGAGSRKVRLPESRTPGNEKKDNRQTPPKTAKNAQTRTSEKRGQNLGFINQVVEPNLKKVRQSPSTSVDNCDTVEQQRPLPRGQTISNRKCRKYYCWRKRQNETETGDM